MRVCVTVWSVGGGGSVSSVGMASLDLLDQECDQRPQLVNVDVPAAAAAAVAACMPAPTSNCACGGRGRLSQRAA